MKKIVSMFLLLFSSYLYTSQDKELHLSIPLFDFSIGEAISYKGIQNGAWMPTVVVAGSPEGLRKESQSFFLQQHEEDDLGNPFVFSDSSLNNLLEEFISLGKAPDKTFADKISLEGKKRKIKQKRVKSNTFVPIKEDFQCRGCDKKFSTLFHLRHHKEKVCFPPKRDRQVNCCFCLKLVCIGALSQHLDLEHFNARVPAGSFPEVIMERCIVEGCSRVFFGDKKTRLKDHLRGDHNVYKRPSHRRYSV